jgi:uncharacterized YccA/Bax inhibitor family protein
LSAKVLRLYEKDKNIDWALTRALYYKPNYIEAYTLVWLYIEILNLLAKLRDR